MKIQLLLVGKTNQDFVKKGVEEYYARLKHYLSSFEIAIIPDIKNTKNLSFDQLKEKEGELIHKYFQPGDFIVLLDEHGKEFSSLAFAEYIEKKMHTVSKRMVFVIGGPYGFSNKIYSAAQEQISLSQLTFSHQLVRLIFIEQLYRAMTILGNEPYHHE
ncbi:MAG: 23S rRNA (pseudouridine(1915)-N(3))-methyltransferase RlmH [Dysgonamonadaceae bacterium]|jgi:23S rRNA (pseudouridine1915-N3)-methyltransferase|nr:23S rRNA (pseudouridine(1915)-N(3))-methyltransferase RlmH [Dysgonamonadaceae bacterium]